MNSLTRTLASLAAATLTCTALVALPATPAAAAPPAGYTHPADACPVTVTGGVEGRDYYFASETWTRNPGSPVTSTLKKLVICSSTPLTLSTGGATVDATVWIEAGTQANITLDGVDIASHVPFTIERNRDAAGNSVDPKTSVHITLAAGSANRLEAAASAYAPGIRCGEDTVLVIDDDVTNVDVDGAPVDVTGGRIKEGTVYVDRDGAVRTAGADGPTTNISNLESRNPGSLEVQGGYLCAAIGGSDWETTGEMTFNGGSITARAVGDGTYGFGAGIGGSHGGHGTTEDTWITFNGGTVTAWASYHGAGIGGGGPSYTTAGSTSRENNYRFPDAKLSDRLPGNGFGANSGTPVHSKVCAGNLRFNGGVVTPISADHGNAIGQGCFCWNVGRKIVITGGTIMPDTSRQDPSYGYAHAIGALGGEVYVTGGSVRIGQVTHDNGKTTNEKYQSYIGDPVDPDNLPSDFYTNFSSDTAYGALDKSSQVMMRTIKVPGALGANARITSFAMTVNGVSYPYGSPHSTDENGNLYLWLPKTTEGEVRVNLTAVDKDGNVVRTEPYYMDDVQNGGDHLKQYVVFSIDPEKVPTLKNLAKRYDGLPWGEDVSGKLLSEVAQQAVEVDNPPVAAGQDKNKLNDAASMVMESQRLATDENGDLIRRPDTGDGSNIYEVDTASAITKGFNANVGKYKLTISSDQYAQDGSSFAESFYGHRCYYDYAEITPADTQTRLEVERVGSTADVRLTAHVSPRHDDAVTEALTCAAPEGAVQFYINGKKVGEPVAVADMGDDELEDGYRQSVATLTVGPDDYRSLLVNPAAPSSARAADGLGSQRVTAEFIPTQKGNYTDSNTDSNADFFVAVDPEWWSYEKVYDGTPAFDGLDGSHILPFVPAGFDVALSFDPAQVTYAPDGSSVGTHPIVLKDTELTGADADKVIVIGYTRGDSLTLKGTVTPRDVTVTTSTSVRTAPAHRPFGGLFSFGADLVAGDSLEGLLGAASFDMGGLDPSDPAPGLYLVTVRPEALRDLEPDEEGRYTLGNYRIAVEGTYVRIEKAPRPVLDGQISTVAQDVPVGGPLQIADTLDGAPVDTERSYFKRVGDGWEPVDGEPTEPGTYLVVSSERNPGPSPALPGSDVFRIVGTGTEGSDEAPGPSREPVSVSADDIVSGQDPRVTETTPDGDPVEVTRTYWRQDPVDPGHWEPVEGVPTEPGTYLVVSVPTDPDSPWGPGSAVFVVEPAPAEDPGPAPGSPDKDRPVVTVEGVDVVDGQVRPRVLVDGKPFDGASDPEGRRVEEVYYVREPDGSWRRLAGAPDGPGDYRVVVRLLDRDGNLLAEASYDFSLDGRGAVLPVTGDVAGVAGVLGALAGLGAAAAAVTALAARPGRRR